jgi:hypothetical protein
MTSSEWVPTATLATELGISQKHLRDTLRREVFKPGVHYLNVRPTGWRPTYRWHRERCLEALNAAAITPEA